MNERLEVAIKTIKNNWPDEKYSMLRDALVYVIEQAERTQELESECADWELGHKQLQNDFEEIKRIAETHRSNEMRLEQQNKRLSERVEELEERLEGSHKYTDALRYRVEELVRQKKRYREMIDEIREYITDCEKLDTEVVSYVIGDIIDEALEED